MHTKYALYVCSESCHNDLSLHKNFSLRQSSVILGIGQNTHLSTVIIVVVVSASLLCNSFIKSISKSIQEIGYRVCNVKVLWGRSHII